MTKLLSNVKKLKDTLLGLEMGLDILESDLFEIVLNLKNLKQMQVSLEYNIEYLKRDKIIAVASEFKRSVELLKTTNSKISKNNVIKNELINQIEQKMVSKDFYQKKFETE